VALQNQRLRSSWRHWLETITIPISFANLRRPKRSKGPAEQLPSVARTPFVMVGATLILFGVWAIVRTIVIIFFLAAQFDFSEKTTIAGSRSPQIEYAPPKPTSDSTLPTPNDETRVRWLTLTLLQR
jgi:hypothetical protein